MTATESGLHGALLVPLRQLTVSLDSSGSTHRDVEPQSRSSQMVLATCDQDVAEEEGMEDSSIHTGKDRTLDTVV